MMNRVFKRSLVVLLILSIVTGILAGCGTQGNTASNGALLS